MTWQAAKVRKLDDRVCALESLLERVEMIERTHAAVARIESMLTCSHDACLAWCATVHPAGEFVQPPKTTSPSRVACCAAVPQQHQQQQQQPVPVRSLAKQDSDVTALPSFELVCDDDDDTVDGSVATTEPYISACGVAAERFSMATPRPSELDDDADQPASEHAFQDDAEVESVSAVIAEPIFDQPVSEHASMHDTGNESVTAAPTSDLHVDASALEETSPYIGMSSAAILAAEGCSQSTIDWLLARTVHPS